MDGFIKGDPALRVRVMNRARPKVASQTAGVRRRIRMKGEKLVEVINAQRAVISIRVSRNRITDNRWVR